MEGEKLRAFTRMRRDLSRLNSKLRGKKSVFNEEGMDFTAFKVLMTAMKAAEQLDPLATEELLQEIHEHITRQRFDPKTATWNAQSLAHLLMILGVEAHK